MKVKIGCSKCNFEVSADMKKGACITPQELESMAHFFGLQVIDNHYVCNRCLKNSGKENEEGIKMNINICAYVDQMRNTRQDHDEMWALLHALNARAVSEEHYVLDTWIDRYSLSGREPFQNFCDCGVFFTLNPDIVSFIERWTYTSHIIILDDLSVCPSLFSGWKQFPSTEGSQEWRPADWERTETTVLVTTRTRLLENVIAFLKREGLSFREGN